MNLCKLYHCSLQLFAVDSRSHIHSTRYTFYQARNLLFHTELILETKSNYHINNHLIRRGARGWRYCEDMEILEADSVIVCYLAELVRS